MDPYSTIPHPGHGAGHHRSGGETPTTIQFLTTRYMKVEIFVAKYSYFNRYHHSLYIPFGLA